MIITPEVIQKFDSVLARGLCKGVGVRDGQMCIEAAICYALDLPHGDDPECVAPAIRSYKIALNDAGWSSPEARAKGLRDLGIAQIGSRGTVDEHEFTRRLAEKTIRQLIPTLFREVFPERSDCLEAADRCEKEGTLAAARAAARAAWATEAACAAAWAARAARAAAWATEAAEAAWATEAACAAAEAAEAACAAAEDCYLSLSASLALEVLREMNAPGCAWV